MNYSKLTKAQLLELLKNRDETRSAVKPLLPGRLRLMRDANVPIEPDPTDANPKNCMYGYINIPADLPPGEHRFAIWKNRKKNPDGTFTCYPGYHGQLSTKQDEDLPD